jgi:hypothetical protein
MQVIEDATIVIAVPFFGKKLRERQRQTWLALPNFLTDT